MVNKENVPINSKHRQKLVERLWDSENIEMKRWGDRIRDFCLNHENLFRVRSENDKN